MNTVSAMDRSDAPPESIFHSLLFGPTLVMVALRQSSLAAGLTVCLFLLCAYLAIQAIGSRARSNATGSVWLLPIVYTTVLAAIWSHGAWAMLQGTNFQTGRFIGSYSVFAVMLLAAMGFTESLLTASNEQVTRWVRHAMWFLVLNALVGLTGLKLFSFSTHKPIGIFSEPSHFALVLAPMLAYQCTSDVKNGRWMLPFFFLWGVLIENLTTLAVVVLCTLVTLRFTASRLILLIAGAGVLLAIDAEYFVSRLAISQDSENLSVLVLLQGWETALLTLEQTAGWGAGFQQFGFASLSGDVAEKISFLGEENLNQFDGGSTAAKLVGEFGWFGVAGLVLVLLLVGRAVRELRRAHARGESGARILLLASLVAVLVELFARGVGYFSPSIFLALCGCIEFLRSRRHGRTFGDGPSAVAHE